MKVLNINRLVELLDYDKSTGIFTWKMRNGRPAPANTVAGSPHIEGYRKIKIDGVSYLAHRLAMMWIDGEMPPNLVDHINGVRDDNRISNLRKVTMAGNQQNRRGAASNSRSGVIGASYRASNGKWVSQIRINGVATHIGSFDTKAQAAEAYLSAKRKHHETCSI
jgi:hypothetical protein